MPITTYRDYPLPRHPNDEIQKMLDEMSEYTNCEWFCEVTFMVRPFWKQSTTKRHTILKHLGGVEYQVLTCTNTEKECLAFLYGALGIVDYIKSSTTL